MTGRRTHIEKFLPHSRSYETLCGKFVFRQGGKHVLIDNGGLPLLGHSIVSPHQAASVPEELRCLVCYGLPAKKRTGAARQAS